MNLNIKNMTTEQLFDISKSHYAEMKKGIMQLLQSSINEVQKLEQVLLLIDAQVRILKSTVKEHVFERIPDEINFFKKIKPLFISEFILCSEILRIETERPDGNPKIVKKYYEGCHRRLNNFYSEHADFCQYVKSNAEYMDTSYFVRNHYNIKLKFAHELHSMDEKFSTSQDHLMAKLMAYRRLGKHLHRKIGLLEGKNDKEEPTSIKWSASKVSLIELLYALHHTGVFNGGNIGFSEVVASAEKSLNIHLGNFYKTLGEIKGRKNERTKFLQRLTDNMQQYLNDCDD